MRSTSRQRRFAIGPCLGRGGFGEVYLATMFGGHDLETQVAIKLLREGLAPGSQAIARLRDEARLLSRLNHPAILKVYDLAVLEGRVALVAEYVDGQDMGACFRGESPLGLRACLECLTSVAGALHVAWATPIKDSTRTLRLVHRDIKPSNMRISRFGQVKLLDFGIARTDQLSREAKTQSNVMIGSPPYMAPERYYGDQVLHQSDVFALGATLYECLTGERLFGELSMMRISALALEAARYTDYLTERMVTLPSSTPLSVIDLLTQTLRYDPEQRPSADAFAQMCETALEHVTGDSLARWCRLRAWPAESEFTGPLVGRIVSESTVIKLSTVAEQDITYPDIAMQDADEVLARDVADVAVQVVPSQVPEPAVNPSSGSRTWLTGVLVFTLVLVTVGGGVTGVGGLAYLAWHTSTPEQPASNDPFLQSEPRALQQPPAAKVHSTRPTPAIQTPATSSAQPTGRSKSPPPRPDARAPASAARAPAPAARVASEGNPVATAAPPPPVPARAPSAPSADPAPGEGAPPVPSAESPPEEPAPNDATPKPPMVYVALEGHASAYLMSGAKRFELPGELPPGEYDLMGVFQGSTPLRFATVRLTPTGHPKVVCHVGFMKCEFFP